jgi:hypothetical protein
MVYLSASKGLPFIPRYLETKLEAENFLFALADVGVTVLKPGFIFTEESWFKYSSSYPINIYSEIFSLFYKYLPDSRIRDFLKNFDVDKSIDVKAVAISAVISAFDAKFNNKTLFNEDMLHLKKVFLEKGYKFD